MPPPLMVGVLSLVLAPSATGLPASSVMPGTVSLVSMMTSTVLLLALPFASVPSITSACSPSSSGASGVKVQLPSASTVAVPRSVSPSVITTVEPGCMPPPLMVGVLSLVLEPSATGLPASSVMPGTVSLVSTVTSTVLLLALPFASVPSTTSACSPSGSGASGVKVQLPSASTVAVPRSVPPSEITTVEPGCMPPPLIVGVLSLVADPSATGLPASSTRDGVVAGITLAALLSSLVAAALSSFAATELLFLEPPLPPEFDAAATPINAARPPKTPPAT